MAPDPHAARRERARDRRRRNAERPDRREWSGVRIPRGYELRLVDGRPRYVDTWGPRLSDRDLLSGLRALETERGVA